MISWLRLRQARRRGGAFLLHEVESLSRQAKRFILAAGDLLLVSVALVLALSLTLNRVPEGAELQRLWLLFPGLTIVGASLLQAMGLPKIKFNAFDWSAILRTGAFAALMAVAGLALDRVHSSGVPASMFLTFGVLLFTLAVLARVIGLQALLWIYRQRAEQRRVLIYGAGATGMQLAAALSTHDTIEAVAFVDDNPALRGLSIAGLPVHGPTELERLIETKRIDRVLLAMPQMPSHKLSLKVLRLQSLGVDVHAVPSFAQLAGEQELLDRIEPVSLEGLLGRAHLNEELPGAEEAFTGRAVMVTGAGGSIGSELCRQLLACKPSRMVLFDISESALYQIDRELRELDSERSDRDSKPIEILPRLGSVTDAAAVRRVIRDCDVQAILHAAAYKHVPLVEENQLAGLANNVLGTRVVADAAREAEVEHFLLVSSDKAVRPRSMMGASKRLAELIVQDLATRSRGTLFSMVRFGNVLGSSGSVIPLFQEQIARGGPVTVTHDEVTRYFMTIPEAARLVLTAVTFARGGDVFVLDMGEPVLIRKLAEQLIESAGLTVQSDDNPNGDIRIVITGLRPGEKLHEELLIGTDRVTTPHPKILRAQEDMLSEIEVANMLRDLQIAIDNWDVRAARQVAMRWIGNHAFDDAQAPAKVAISTLGGS